MVIQTDRLQLRKLSVEDAGFILRLLNEPSFIKNIGDKGVRTMEDATSYILNGTVASYDRFGFGMYLVETREAGVPIGICGLSKREALADVDIGYAFLPEFWSKGYALESAAAVIAYARETLGFKRIAAVTNADNHSSIRLLEKIGFRYETMVRLSDEALEIKLFVCDV